MALRDCALDRGAHEILFADDVGSASTNLLCGQQSMPDQADNGHLADAKTTCGFAQDQFMPLRAFTFAIDWYVMRTAEVAHAQLRPGLSLAERIPSRLRTGAMLWSGKKTREFAHQLLGRHVGLEGLF